MSKQNIEIQPLGGLGQIGSNMCLFKCGTTSLLVDSGILFPYDDFYEIKYLIPDLSEISPPDAIIITHGHEDHIGAICEIVKFFPNTEIHSPLFASKLIRNKLYEKGLAANINVYKADDQLDINGFIIQPIQVNHSIPDTYAIHIKEKRSDLGILFASDFKIDHSNRHEKPMDLKKVKELSLNSKYRLLMPDSTNITSSMLKAPAEDDLLDGFEKVFKKNADRIFITTFASNIFRLANAAAIAHKYGYKVFCYGKAMSKYIQTAIDSDICINELKYIRDINHFRSEYKKVLILTSGCQAEFKSTLRRITLKQDPVLKIRKGDLVVFSSKAIPGNEKKISILHNLIVEEGGEVITPADINIHATGHACKEDLKTLADTFNPTHIIPVHGESLFLKKHKEFFSDICPDAKSLNLFNFSIFEYFGNGKYEVIVNKPKEPLIYHGKGILIERSAISERRKMACSGMIVISISSRTKRESSLIFSYKGLPQNFMSLKEEFQRAIFEFTKRNIKLANDDLSEEVRIFTRRYASNHLGYKPVTIVHVL